MKSTDNHPEDVLRDALRAKAGDAIADLTFEEIRRNARTQQRRTTRRTALLVAAAVAVAVGVPTAYLLRPSNNEPAPAPQPTQSPTASPSATAAADHGLAAIPRGADPTVAYFRDGLVHEPDGSTTHLPGEATDVVEFTPYHGGWFVLDSVGGLVQYDSSGAVVLRSHQEGASLAVTPDQMRTAFLVDNHIRAGISTGMGEGESDLQVGAGASMAGLIGDDRVVYNSASGVVASDFAGRATILHGLSSAFATSAGHNLVGGVAPDGTSGRVVSADTGGTLWTSAWQPMAFSPDGRYVAASLFSENSDTTDVAILDAQSGSVVSRLSLTDRHLSQAGPLTWEQSDGALLVDVQDAHGQAVLRIGRDGTVTRATDVDGATFGMSWAFAVTP
jgi:hypothetical protein